MRFLVVTLLLCAVLGHSYGKSKFSGTKSMYNVQYHYYCALHSFKHIQLHCIKTRNVITSHMACTV